eukprot:876211-Amphidinium_carterae.2
MSARFALALEGGVLGGTPMHRGNPGQCCALSRGSIWQRFRDGQFDTALKQQGADRSSCPSRRAILIATRKRFCRTAKENAYVFWWGGVGSKTQRCIPSMLMQDTPSKNALHLALQIELDAKLSRESAIVYELGMPVRKEQGLQAQANRGIDSSI